MRMSTSLIGLAGLVLVVAYVFVLMNRASPAVVGAALPAATALLSALALVFAFNRPVPISRVFPVIFVVEKASLLPVTIPNRPFPFESLSLPDMMRQIDPKIFDPPNGQNAFDFITPLYHEYLQKMFVADLALKQFGTWRMKTERFVDLIQWSPMPDASSYPSRILSVEELERIFGKNRFARVYSGFGKWALPPGTELRIELPRKDPQLGDIGTIHLKNRLCEISIRTAGSFSGVELGKYTPLVGVGIGEAQEKYWTLQYITRIDVSFPWYRIGDPDMALHREWANAIVEELAFSFDEESIWTRTKDNFILDRHFQALPPGTKLPVGPIRVSKGSATPEEREPKPDGK